VLLAANKGFGTLDMDKIDFTSDVSVPAVAAGVFNSIETDSPETIFSWRKTASEQALFYRDHRDQLIDQYENEYIFLQRGEVVWHGNDLSLLRSRRELSGRYKTESLFLSSLIVRDRAGKLFGIRKRTGRDDAMEG
jgi:hypothetical protein